MRKFAALSKEELRHIDHASVEILEKAGVHVDSDNALEIFSNGGARRCVQGRRPRKIDTARSCTTGKTIRSLKDR